MRRSIAVLAFVAALLMPSLMASAVGTNGPVVLTANYGGQIATWQHTFAPGETWYALGSPVDLKVGDQVVAQLKNLSCGMQSDPEVLLDFAVHAFVPLNFTLNSSTLTFPVIDPAMGFATAGMTLTTDFDGGAITGNFAGGRAYEATYNGGTIFADLDPSFSTGPDNTAVESDRLPAAGFAPIAGPVTSMHSSWNFNLTGGDSASGTSRYEIQPVPDASSLALAISGALPLLAGATLRRRRRA